LSAYLHSKYEIITKDVTFYLNMKINRRSNEIYLSQIKYIRNLLQKHDIKKCVSASILMIEIKLKKASDNYICNQTHLKDYQILLDELMHLMIQIRSDIAYFISRLTQFMINSTDDHWIALKRVLRYLQKTKELRIHYTNVDHLIMKTYLDAS
jgi:hypothetical protein